MKKIISLLLVLTLMLGLAACGGSNNEPTPSGNPPAETQDKGGATEQTQPQTEDKQPSVSGEITEEILRAWPETPASDFSYENSLNFDGILITAYNGSDDIVVIPAQIEGKAVVEVAGYTFANDSMVRAVLIPDTVVELREVFPNNELLEVVVADGVHVIRYANFLNCKNLHTLALNKDITVIEDSAFANCISLTEIRLPLSVENADEEELFYAFYGCWNLTMYSEEGSIFETVAEMLEIPFVAE